MARARAGAIGVCVACTLITACEAAAQSVEPGPPGPYVVDVRGATMALPQAFGFYPNIPAETLVPARGFGGEAGGHVYFGQLGPARLGAGASVVMVRGTAGESAATTVRIFAPQFSFNFGTSRGWSYVSGGMGVGDVHGRYTPVEMATPAERASRALPALNVGGGARWFFTTHIAFTFDVRLHRLGTQQPSPGNPGTPAALLGSASVGLSFK